MGLISGIENVFRKSFGGFLVASAQLLGPVSGYLLEIGRLLLLSFVDFEDLRRRELDELKAELLHGISFFLVLFRLTSIKFLFFVVFCGFSYYLFAFSTKEEKILTTLLVGFLLITFFLSFVSSYFYLLLPVLFVSLLYRTQRYWGFFGLMYGVSLSALSLLLAFEIV